MELTLTEIKPILKHIIDNNYACDSQILPITEEDIFDTAREIVYYS